MHALSDTEAEFHEPCRHKLDVTCDRCEPLESTLTEIELAISSENVQLRYGFPCVDISIEDISALVENRPLVNIYRTLHPGIELRNFNILSSKGRIIWKVIGGGGGGCGNSQAV